MDWNGMEGEYNAYLSDGKDVQWRQLLRDFGEDVGGEVAQAHACWRERGQR